MFGKLEIPDVRWVDPHQNAWPGLDFATLASLACVLEWNDKALGPGAVCESQVDTLDDSKQWIAFTNGPEASQIGEGYRRVRTESMFEGDGSDHKFIRARLRRGGEYGRSTAAFFIK
jgi:hypothetical protein